MDLIAKLSFQAELFLTIKLSSSKLLYLHLICFITT